jgi:hypothetical protein
LVIKYIAHDGAAVTSAAVKHAQRSGLGDALAASAAQVTSPA